MQKRLFYLPLIFIGLLVVKGTVFGQWMPMLSESVSIDPFSGNENGGDGGFAPFCTNTVITSQPASISVCNPAGGSFSVTASGTNLTYRWEVNYGTVWNTISNGSLYSGVNSNTLNITSSTSSMNGYQYRCVIGSDCPTIYSLSVTLTVVAINPVVTAGSALTFCQGGSVVLTSSSATGNTWSNGETTPSITATSSGSYSVTVNISGCSETSAPKVVTATQPHAATISYAGSPFCSNQNGTFPVTLTGTTGGTFSASDNKLSISQSNGSIVPNAGTNAIGTYTVTYTTPAGGGCPAAVATTQVTITKASYATISYGSTAICGSSSTPRQVNVTGTQGGTFSAPAGLNINSATGDIIGSQSTPGTYTVTYTNAATGGCPAVSTNTQVTVSEPAAATISYAGSPFCTSPLGSVPVVLTGTTGGTFSATPSGLSINSSTGRVTPYASTAGIYTVNYSMAAAGCTNTFATTTVEIVQQPSTPVITASGPLSICSGENVILTSSAPTGNTWSNGATTQSITVNTAGSYTVTTTIDHCAASAASQVKTVTVKTLPVITLGTVSHPASCGANGSIQILGSGTGTINWTGSASGSVSATLPYSLQLPAGTYSITFTGANSCASLPLTQTLNNPSGAVPTIAANGPTSFCTGGSVVLTSSSATGNLWSTGATTQSITVNATGNYSVTVTVSGCATTSLTTAVSVNTPPSTPFITGSGPMVVCSGEEVILTSSSSTGNVWSNGATTPSIAVNVTGNYTVTVTSGGCSKTSGPSTVTVHPLPVISTGTVVNPTCSLSNGTIQVNGTGTGILSWTGPVPGNSTITAFPFVMPNLSAGTYSISFTNSNNCVSSTLVHTLTDPGAPATPIITADGTLTFCAGEDVVLTSSSTTGNLWSNGATTQSITVASSGNYTVAVSAGGCSSTSAPTSVTVKPVTTLALGTVSNPASCGTATGSIQVTGTGTGTLNWTGTSAGTAAVSSLPFVISNLGSGAYSISLTNPNGCVSNTLTRSLSDPGAPAIPVIAASGSTTFCSGGNVVLTSSAATGNLWSNGATSQSITVNSTGSYSVTVTSGGCSSTSASTGVTVNPVHAISTGTLVNPSACLSNTGSIQINGTGSGTLSWTGASTGNAGITAFPYVIQNLGAGTYALTFSSGGCISNSVSATLNDPATPAIPAITAVGSTTFCSGGNVVLTSSAATGNLWSTGETTQSVTVSSAGTYTVAVSQSGCSATSAGTTVSVTALPVISAGTVVNATCSQNNGSIQITGTSTTGVLNWTGTVSGTANISNLPHTLSNLGAGTYTFTFTNGSGCVSNVLTQAITNTAAPATPIIDANGPLTFCSGGNVVLTSSSATNNLWSTGVTTQSITVTAGGTYSLTVGTAGCTATASITVTVKPLPNTTLPVLKAVCSHEPSFALTGGLPAGGTYSGTGVTGGNFNPATAGVGITTITYTVTLNGCSKSATNTILVNGCLGIDDKGAEDLLIIYPNPTTGIIYLEGANLSEYAKVELLDATGRLIQSWKINASTMKIDVSGIATGNYNLHVSGKEGNVVKKVQVL